MDPSKRVWAWAGAVLAVACAALGVANLLLHYFVNQPVDYADPSGQNQIVIQNVAPTFRSAQDDVGLKPGDSEGTELKYNSALPRKRGLAARGSSEKPKTKIQNPRAPAPSSQCPVPNVIRPLGIVEKADGRVQAVIQDGEWTRLVEEGEVLADNSRVLRVSAEAVEILRPQGAPEIVLASTKKPAAAKEAAQPEVDLQTQQPESEWAWSRESVRPSSSRKALARSPAADALPGMVSGDASYHATSLKPPSRPGILERHVQEAPSPSDFTTLPETRIEEVANPTAPLGRVEYADGRAESVLADGQWVKLVAERAGSQPDSADASSEVPSLEAPAPVEAKSTALEVIQNSESPLPNSVEPIGIVEWGDGRAQAIVAHGSFVNFAEDAEAVAETRRALLRMPPPERFPEAPGLSSDAISGRQREEELADLVMAEDESATRGPPGELGSALGLPEELARGQPELGEGVDQSRAPPAVELGFPFDVDGEVPGLDHSAAARFEQLNSIQSPLHATPSEKSGALTGSVLEFQPRTDGKPLSSLANEDASTPNHAPNPSEGGDRGQDACPKLLGIVDSWDGRTLAVVAQGESVTLVESADLRSCQERASSQVAAIGAAERPAKAGRAGHPRGAGAHPTQSAPGGSGLQSESCLRDNQRQSHR